MGASIQSDTPVRVDREARAEYLEFACHLARLAGEVILPRFRHPLAVENKKAGTEYDPVTEADRAAERTMRAEILGNYPSHGVLGEEFGLEMGDGLTWVLDPIDGTRGFVMGLLHWGTLVALFDGQRPVVGAIRHPVLDETFAGDGGRAVYTRGREERALATRPCRELGWALAGTTAPELFRTERQVAGFDRIRRLARGMRYGTDCYLYAMLAMGLADLVIEANLKPYDVQALIPVVEGAGGVITDWDGGNPAMGGEVRATGDGRLHERVLAELRA
ncbi:MAG: inositol monophosphatase family protein [Gammaproteobacteria bacterium]|nr:inositol monophosphatase family protein [Gammaproteobacteria bacterium]